MTREELNGYAMRVSQASKTELIVIMYEAAIQYIEDGTAALERQDAEQFRHDIRKAKAFVNELASALDMRYPVSLNLLRLYTYMTKVMVKADITLKTEELLRVKNMLVRLCGAFGQVSREDRSGPVMQNTQQVYAGLTYSRNALNESCGSAADIKRGYTV